MDKLKVPALASFLALLLTWFAFEVLEHYAPMSTPAQVVVYLIMLGLVLAVMGVKKWLKNRKSQVPSVKD